MGQTIENLSSGVYCVVVTDNSCGVARGCWEVKCCPFLLEENQIEYNISNPACIDQLGEIELILSNIDMDAFPLDIHFENMTDFTEYDFEVASNISHYTDLPIGEYIVRLDYGGGCSYSFEFEIEIAKLEIQFQTTPSCDNDGTIEAIVFGGEAPYTFAWQDDANETTSIRTGLGSNLYTIIVTDNNDCTNGASVFIKNADPIDIENMEYYITNAHCDVPGSISIYPPSGGSAPFTYACSNGVSGSLDDEDGDVIYNLAAGNYTVTLTDVEGCSATLQFEIGLDGLPDIP